MQAALFIKKQAFQNYIFEGGKNSVKMSDLFSSVDLSIDTSCTPKAAYKSVLEQLQERQDAINSIITTLKTSAGKAEFISQYKENPYCINLLEQ